MLKKKHRIKIDNDNDSVIDNDWSKNNDFDMNNDIYVKHYEDTKVVKHISLSSEKTVNSPKDIHSVVSQARAKLKDINNNNPANEAETVIERLEKLKSLRDNYQNDGNDFQSMLNKIKERNFEERMNYIMSRIKQSQRPTRQNKSEQEPVIKLKPNQKDVPTGTGKNEYILPRSRSSNTGNESKRSKIDSLPNEHTITLTISQFKEIVKDTVEDVLIDLGIKSRKD